MKMKTERRPAGTPLTRCPRGLALGHPEPSSPERKLGLGAGASWPVFECMISAWWRDPSHLTHILVAKAPPFHHTCWPHSAGRQTHAVLERMDRSSVIW